MKILAQDVRIGDVVATNEVVIRAGYSALPRKIDLILKDPKTGRVRTAMWNKYTVISVNRVSK